MYIKYLLVLFSFFVFFSQTAYAEYKETDKNAIKVLIAKVKTVEPSQRRVLMNELKIMLRSMHQSTRTQVMLDLRRAFSNDRSVQTRNRAKQSNMHHQTTMSMTESKHMQEHMMESSMGGERPGGGRPGGERPPMQGNPETRPPSQGMSPQDTQHTPMRGM